MGYVKLVAILIVLIINCGAGELKATDIPRIIFTGLSSSTPQQALYYTVLANKPMHLYFTNMSHGWCYDYNDHEDILDIEKKLPIIENSTIPFENVTRAMSTLWKCTVKAKNKGRNKKKLINYYYYYLNLHVKGAKPVEITMNGTELTLSEADLSAPYDGYTIYFYEDGDNVRIDCRNPHRTGSVHLKYFTKDGTNISDSATFFIQLHSESENSYIDCVYNSTDPEDTYVYRVNFVTKNKGWSSLLILGSIGAVLIILGLIGIALWYVRTRNAKHNKTPYADLSDNNYSPTPQCTNECEIQYDECHYSENLSNEEHYYEIPDRVKKNMDPEDHCYAEVDYVSCKTKIGKTQTRDNKLYDEPYVQITARVGIQALQKV